LVRGPISRVVGLLPSPRGEFTVVANIGQTTNIGVGETLAEADIPGEFGEMTNRGAMRRRQAISALAKKYSTPAGEIYQVIERAKKCGK
jgi:hypothetical protein